MVWLSLSFFSLLFSYLAFKERSLRLRGFYLALLIMVMSYVTGFGGLVGQDHAHYAEFYHRWNSIASLKDYSFIQSFIGRGQQEFLWTLLMIVGNYIGLGEAGFFFLVALITNTLLVKVFYKFPNPIFAVFLFIVSTHYFQEVNLVRQILAISISLFGVCYLEEKKMKNFLICIACATLIHVSSILFLLFALFPLLSKESNDSNNKVDRVVTWVVAAVWLFSVYAMITGREIPFLQEYMGMAMTGTAYEMYVDSAGVGMEGQIHYVYNLFIVLSFFVNRRKHFFLWLMFVIGGILDNFAVSIPNITRLAYNFTIAFFVIVPYICDKRNYPKKNGSIIDALMIFTILYYTRELVFNHILNPNELLGTKMYSITDFFK